MATHADDLDRHVDVHVMPVIDIRSLSQDEICSVARLFPNHQDDKWNFVITSAINSSLFNESSGSRKQTYERHKPSRKSEGSHVDLHGNSTGSGFCKSMDKRPLLERAEKDLTEKRRAREYRELIDLICHQMEKHAHLSVPLNMRKYKTADAGLEGSDTTKANVIQDNFAVHTNAAQKHSMAEDRNVDVDFKDGEKLVALEHTTSNLALEDLHANCSNHFEGTNSTLENERFSGNDNLGNQVDGMQLKLVAEAESAQTRIRAKEEVEAKILEMDREDILTDIEGFHRGLEVPHGAGKGSEETNAATVKHVREAVLMRMTTPEITEKEIASDTTALDESLTFRRKGTPSSVMDEDPVKAATHLCLTCKGTFANRYSLQRHLKRFRHKGQKLASYQFFAEFAKACDAPGAGPSSIRFLNSERFRKSICRCFKGLAEGVSQEGLKASPTCHTSHHFLDENRNAKVASPMHLVRQAEGSKEGENAGVCICNPMDCLEGFSLKHSLKEQEVCKENIYLDLHDNRALEKNVSSGRVINLMTLASADENDLKCNKSDLLRKHPLHSASNGHTIKRLKYTHCDKTFHRQKEHLNHLKVHSKNMRRNFLFDMQVVNESGSSSCNFVCEKCGKSFNQRQKYLGHCLVHIRRRKKRPGAILEQSGRPSRLVGDGKSQSENHTNMFKYACKLCGKVFDQRRKCNSHLSVHSKNKEKTCNNPFEFRATRNGCIKILSDPIEQPDVHLLAPSNIFNQMQMDCSSEFHHLRSDFASGWQVPFGGDLGACRQDNIVKIKDGVGMSFPSPSDYGGIVLQETPKETSRALVENVHLKKQLMSIQGMKNSGWSAKGCFVCQQVGGENTRLVVCTWCETEFHSSCFVGLPNSSGDRVCPRCRTTLVGQNYNCPSC